MADAYSYSFALAPTVPAGTAETDDPPPNEHFELVDGVTGTTTRTAYSQRSLTGTNSSSGPVLVHGWGRSYSRARVGSDIHFYTYARGEARALMNNSTGAANTHSSGGAHVRTDANAPDDKPVLFSAHAYATSQQEFVDGNLALLDAHATARYQTDPAQVGWPWKIVVDIELRFNPAAGPGGEWEATFCGLTINGGPDVANRFSSSVETAGSACVINGGGGQGCSGESRFAAQTPVNTNGPHSQHSTRAYARVWVDGEEL